MANLRLFDPVFDESFDRGFSGFLRPFRFEPEVELPQIKIDVEEDETSYVVKADIPGVNKEEISVNVERGVVSIQAEVKKEKDVKEGKGKVLRSERSYGMASRSFSLAQDVDQSRSVAEYKNGVLRLVLPKTQSKAAKRLQIQ